MATAKQAASQLIDHLPDEVSWDDIMYELYVREKIECHRNQILGSKHTGAGNTQLRAFAPSLSRKHLL